LHGENTAISRPFVPRARCGPHAAREAVPTSNPAWPDASSRADAQRPLGGPFPRISVWRIPGRSDRSEQTSGPNVPSLVFLSSIVPSGEPHAPRAGRYTLTPAPSASSRHPSVSRPSRKHNRHEGETPEAWRSRQIRALAQEEPRAVRHGRRSTCRANQPAARYPTRRLLYVRFPVRCDAS
jgi:hypothetical protein